MGAETGPERLLFPRSKEFSLTKFPKEEGIDPETDEYGHECDKCDNISVATQK